MNTWADLTARLNLETKNYEKGVDGAIGKTAALESRLGSAKSSIGAVRTAMSGMSGVMGESLGPAGSLASSVSNMIHAFQVHPIVGVAVALGSTFTYAAKKAEQEADAVAERAKNMYDVFKRGRMLQQEMGILPEDNPNKEKIRKLMANEDEKGLMRERAKLDEQARDEGQITSPGQLARLEKLRDEIRLYDDALDKLAAIKEEKRAQEVADARAAKVEREALRDVRNQQELAGKEGVEAARIKLKHAKEAFEYAESELESERARRDILVAEAEIKRESEPEKEKTKKEKDTQPPEFERLVQLGAILRAPPAASGGSNIAQMQLQEARRQTGILTDIRAHSGRF